MVLSMVNIFVLNVQMLTWRIREIFFFNFVQGHPAYSKQIHILTLRVSNLASALQH